MNIGQMLGRIHPDAKHIAGRGAPFRFLPLVSYGRWMMFRLEPGSRDLLALDSYSHAWRCPSLDQLGDDLVDLGAWRWGISPAKSAFRIARACGRQVPSTREHALMFIYGPGGNGKSVFLNTLAGLLGGYNSNAAMDTFTDSGTRHLTFLAMLSGARMVTAAETEEGRAWAETKIKEMTGGTPITANYMRRDPFTFVPKFKITITGNHKPALKNVDEAARRRFNIVPFLHTPERPDRELEERLKAEWPAILRWMIDGCLDWQRHGLVRPAVVREATSEYFAAQDIIGRWIAERCILDPSLTEKPGRLLADCRDWAAENGETPLTAPQFRSGMEKVKGVRYATLRGKLEARGIGFQAQQPPFNEAQGGEGGGGWG